MAMLYTHWIGNQLYNTMVVFKLRDSVPSARYSRVFNVLMHLYAHVHNVKRTLHLTIERQPDGSTSLFEMLPCERLPCFSSW